MNQWKDVFDCYFKDGDFVVVEDHKGLFRYGYLFSDDNGIILRHGSTPPTLRLDWDQIVFIAHDGFPVQAMRQVSDEAVNNLCLETNEELLRASLLRAKRRVTLGGGCPFIFGPANVIDLVNPGNRHPLLWGTGQEETLVLECGGATMLSYDLSHHFLFDGLPYPDMQ